MTIRLPEPNILDRFLNLLGKKRGVKIPIGAFEKFGPHFSAKAYKESFWKALFRSRYQDLPEGLVDVFFIEDIRNEADLR
jgi:hypothetical protein